MSLDRIGKLGAGFVIAAILAIILPIVTVDAFGVVRVSGYDMAGIWGVIAVLIAMLVVAAPRLEAIIRYRNILGIALGVFAAGGLIRLLYVLFSIKNAMRNTDGFGDLGAMMENAVQINWIGAICAFAATGLGLACGYYSLLSKQQDR